MEAKANANANANANPRWGDEDAFDRIDRRSIRSRLFLDRKSFKAFITLGLTKNVHHLCHRRRI